MVLNQQQRNQVISDLATNCECWSHPGDRDVLNSLSDDKLLQLRESAIRQQQAIAVANTAVNGFTDGGGLAYRINPETGQWEYRTVNASAGSMGSVDRGDDRPGYPAHDSPHHSPGELEGSFTGVHDSGGRDRAGGVDEDEDDKDEFEVTGVGTPKKGISDNYRRPRTTEEWIRNAPPELQNTFRTAQAIEQREKDKIIAQLLVNVADSEKRAHYQRLQTRSLDDLNNDLYLLPKQPTSEDLHRVTNTARVGVRRSTGGDDILPLPETDWKSFKEGGGQTSAAEIAVSNTGGESRFLDGPSDEEVMRQLPAHLRSAVQNAVVIEARERRRLIQELTANISDDHEEKRLVQRLSNKSLDELRDLQALAPKQESLRANYFGSAAPLSNQQGGVSSVNEDVLPLPRMEWKETKTANG